MSKPVIGLHDQTNVAVRSAAIESPLPHRPGGAASTTTVSNAVDSRERRCRLGSAFFFFLPGITIVRLVFFLLCNYDFDSDI